MVNNSFQYFFDVANSGFYVAEVFLLCCECYYLMLCCTDGASEGKCSHQTSKPEILGRTIKKQWRRNPERYLKGIQLQCYFCTQSLFGTKEYNPCLERRENVGKNVGFRFQRKRMVCKRLEWRNKTFPEEWQARVQFWGKQKN